MARVVLHTYGRNRVKVSTQWLAALRGADRAGVDFIANSGARTETEQKRLIREKGCWSPSNRTGAACPWDRSNHVVKNRPNHSLDVDTGGGGENELQRWLNKHRGVRAVNTVPGEDWHLDINRLGLRILYFRYRKHITKKERRK